ncbi:MAG: hypothetical protein OXG78_11215 [Chloroflexi bacterium]|nr:hypothetical protein [Chloroflexota bacterium]
MTAETERGEILLGRFAEEFGYVPVFGDPNLAKAFNDEELVDYFAYGIGLWIAKPLGTLHRMALEDPDFGFAIMFVVNSFPEFLGKIQGCPKNKRYLNGIRYILGDDVSEDLASWLHKRMRHAIAHSLLVQEGIIIYARGNVPIRYNRDKTAVVITPVAFAQACLIAISNYIRALQAELKNAESANTDFLGNFKKYMISEKQEYFSVQLHGTSYGCRERIDGCDNITENIRQLNVFQGPERTIEKPDVVVENPGQLLKLCKQLIRGD